MPRNGKTSITVHGETHEELKDAKPDGVTWDYWLKEAKESWVREQEDT